MKKYILTFLAFLALHSIKAQESGIFQKKEFITGGDTLKYQIMYPKNYDASKKYPLVLFLHGAGERGNDNERQMALGSKIFLEQQNQINFPAIVLFPQCPDGIMWTHRKKFKKSDRMVFEFPVSVAEPKPAQLVDKLVNETIANTSVDINKMYVMGVSMGGIATLEFLYRFPEKYTAGIVICGGHNPDLARYYANTPVWFLHGDKDDVVPMYYSQEVYKVLKKENKKTRYTTFKDGNHNAWDASFAKPELLAWLFQFEK